MKKNKVNRKQRSFNIVPLIVLIGLVVILLTLLLGLRKRWSLGTEAQYQTSPAQLGCGPRSCGTTYCRQGEMCLRYSYQIKDYRWWVPKKTTYFYFCGSFSRCPSAKPTIGRYPTPTMSRYGPPGKRSY